MTTDLRLAAQFALGLVFLMSALPKARDPRRFARHVIDYKVIPDPLAVAAAWALIPAEIFLAFAFLTGWMIRLALPLATLCIIGFLIAVATNLRRDRTIPCGCFGNNEERIGLPTVARLLLLLGAVATVAAIEEPTGKVLTYPDVFTAPETLITRLLPTSFLAGFLLLLGAWLLELPKLIQLERGFAHRQPLSEARQR